MTKGEELRVIVVMARNNIFPWQRSSSFPAHLRYTPAGPGDTFIFDVEGVGKVRINGASSEFVGTYPDTEHKEGA